LQGVVEETLSFCENRLSDNHTHFTEGRKYISTCAFHGSW